MKRLTISLAALCVLEAGVIVYLWADRRDVNRFQHLSPGSKIVFDKKTGQECWAGPRYKADDWSKPADTYGLPFCTDLK